MKKVDLLLCRGNCRAVYHLKCALTKDKSIEQQQEAGTFEQKQYVCRKCAKLKKVKNFAADTPITEDPECRKFSLNNPENLLLDKVI